MSSMGHISSNCAGQGNTSTLFQKLLHQSGHVLFRHFHAEEFVWGHVDSEMKRQLVECSHLCGIMFTMMLICTNSSVSTAEGKETSVNRTPL